MFLMLILCSECLLFVSPVMHQCLFCLNLSSAQLSVQCCQRVLTWKKPYVLWEISLCLKQHGLLYVKLLSYPLLCFLLRTEFKKEKLYNARTSFVKKQTNTTLILIFIPLMVWLCSESTLPFHVPSWRIKRRESTSGWNGFRFFFFQRIFLFLMLFLFCFWFFFKPQKEDDLMWFQRQLVQLAVSYQRLQYKVALDSFNNWHRKK